MEKVLEMHKDRTLSEATQEAYNVRDYVHVHIQAHLHISSVPPGDYTCHPFHSPCKALELKDLVPLERCRLVKYDEYTEALDQSFEEQEVEMISDY